MRPLVLAGGPISAALGRSSELVLGLLSFAGSEGVAESSSGASGFPERGSDLGD